MVNLEEERKIPKKAVKPLIEYCEKACKQAGVSAVELFRHYLQLMKKYDYYFFSKPWTETPERVFCPDDLFGFGDEEWQFIDSSRSYEDECDRFVVACLRRNISLAGFDAAGFVFDIDFYGRMACGGCVVSHVTWLRSQVALRDKFAKEREEEMKNNPSLLTIEMDAYSKKPEVIRQDKMFRNELRFLEEGGLAEGKSCEVNNKYKCPHGKMSTRLIKQGSLAQTAWEIIQWYDFHWNPSLTCTLGGGGSKWYHYDEPGILDVTDYDGIWKAFGDGRFDKLVEEYKKYKESLQDS